MKHILRLILRFNRVLQYSCIHVKERIDHKKYETKEYNIKSCKVVKKIFADVDIEFIGDQIV